MAKFSCHCGYVIDLVESPAKEEFQLIPERLLESLWSGIADGTVTESVFFDSIRDQGGRAVIECPNCARLWVQNALDGGSFNYAPFVREADVINGTYFPPDVAE
ncbi:hypothetical protein ACI2IY_03705 [Lysobacter enzymogenes]|uniref:hypothetical protein n=1 Tax=Lysobacter enzymogenes TaxID=69 RepID=UPI00384F4D51